MCNQEEFAVVEERPGESKPEVRLIQVVWTKEERELCLAQQCLYCTIPHQWKLIM